MEKFEILNKKNNQNNQISFSVNVKNLLIALNFANLIVEKRNILKNLHYIRLLTNQDSLFIDATDLDIYLRQKISLFSISEPGEIILHSQILLDLVRKLKSENISFSKKINNNYIEITSGNSYFKLFTFEISKFPQIENIQEDISTEISIKTSELSDIISKTLFASSNEVTRYNLNGIFLHKINQKIIAVATDAHRLALSNVINENNKNNFGVILSKKASQDILKIIRDSYYANSQLKILLTVNKIKLTCENFIFISKIVEGEYPSYKEFIPQDESNCLKIDKRTFLESVERVSTLSHHKFRSIKISILHREKIVRFTCFNENAGSAKEDIKFSQNKENFCLFTNNKDISINLNPEYLLEAVMSMDGEIIFLFLINENSPIKIQDINNNLSVIMPLKI
ncbi:MAG: DNA polymerase III subunit beta [Rickettsia sp.]|nr:DNA polymerase III subunit beta [Rickettsia sp.]